MSEKKTLEDIVGIAEFYSAIASHAKSFEKAGMNIRLDDKVVSFDYRGRTVSLLRGGDDTELFDTLSMARERFVEEEYSHLKVKDKVVLDIGANRGDSAIYFALNGARRVYSFEPYPFSFEIARANVEANNLNENIELVNAGIGKNPGKVRIEENFRNYLYSTVRDYGTGKDVEIVTVDDIVKRYGVGAGSKLKLDCEGCEYDVIMNSSPDTLKRFDQIVMEYHYGHKLLKHRLQSIGYEVSHSEKHLFVNPEAENPLMYMGVIRADLNKKDLSEKDTSN